MNDIQIFQNNQFGQIRVAMNESGDPLFGAADIARSLGYARPADAVSAHCKGVVVLPTPTDGGIQPVKFIPEADMYRLIMRSNLPQAEQYQDWVCGEVLPAIRKHGGYLSPQKIEEALLNPDTIIQLATSLKEERVKRIELESRIEEQAPAVTFTSAVVGSQNSCLIGELAKILRQNGIEIGEKRLFGWLRENGYLGRCGERYNIPNQQYVEQGLFELKKGVRTGNSGVLHTTITPKVTGKGQVYFINKFLSRQTA